MPKVIGKDSIDIPFQQGILSSEGGFSHRTDPATPSKDVKGWAIVITSTDGKEQDYGKIEELTTANVPTGFALVGITTESAKIAEVDTVSVWTQGGFVGSKLTNDVKPSAETIYELRKLNIIFAKEL